MFCTHYKIWERAGGRGDGAVVVQGAQLVETGELSDAWRWGFSRVNRTIPSRGMLFRFGAKFYRFGAR